MVASVEESLLAAQERAKALFAQIVRRRMIRPGLRESELSDAIHALAREQFGVRRHWHKRLARCGPNTVLTYHDDAPDREIAHDDIVYLDFGPLFGEWEADFGRSYVLGSDPLKRKLVGDIGKAFRRGKRHFAGRPDMSAGELYDYVSDLAHEYGWEFGNRTAGHLIGQFPHEASPRDPGRFSIRHGNALRLDEPDGRGRPRHWILEIHFVDRKHAIGGFYEELLTL